MKKNILITGAPGTGKTTLIMKIAAELAGRNPAGFYTEEIREGGVRKGFSLISLDGDRGILSHVNIRSPFKVGKYGIDVNGFERFLDRLPFLEPGRRLLIIDEIGKMECFSRKFIQLTTELLSSERPVVATVAMKGSGFIAEVKTRPDVELIELTRDNRDGLFKQILSAITTNVKP
jgi:nucleoside-triphosphatase